MLEKEPILVRINKEAILRSLTLKGLEAACRGAL